MQKGSFMSEDNEFSNMRSADDVPSYSVPQFKNAQSDRFYDYETNIFDYEHLDDLNMAIKNARLALFEITDKINEAERKEKHCKVKYEREHRRAYLKATQKTEKDRKAYADLQCEDLEDNAIVYEQVRIDLIRISNSIRLELQTLQALGNNIRQQMKME